MGIEKFVFQSTIKARILATFTIINTFGSKEFDFGLDKVKKAKPEKVCEHDSICLKSKVLSYGQTAGVKVTIVFVLLNA